MDSAGSLRLLHDLRLCRFAAGEAPDPARARSLRVSADGSLYCDDDRPHGSRGPRDRAGCGWSGIREVIHITPRLKPITSLSLPAAAQGGERVFFPEQSRIVARLY